MRATRLTPALLFTAALLAPQPAEAQALKEIGKTPAGTPVYLEPKSVSRANGIVTATLRVALAPPIKAPTGDYVALKSVAMFDCAKQTSATKERWFYTDAAFKKVTRHDVPGKPGFGPALKGSLADVGLTALCKAGG